MGKIGNFQYPEIKITDAIELARIIQDRFQGRVTNQDAFCAELGHTNPRSGAYAGKMTALRRYGFISGRDELLLTQLATKILIPTSEEERTEAVAQAVENVELFKEIFERLGEAIPKDNFWVDLVEITGEDRSIAQKDAMKIRTLYLDSYEYLVSARKDEIKPKIEERVAHPLMTERQLTDALFELRTREYGTLIAKDEKTIAVARELIDVIEEEFKAKKRSEESNNK